MDKKDIRTAAIASIKASSLLDEQIHILNEALKNNPKVTDLARLIQIKIIRAGKKGLDNEVAGYFTQIYQNTQRIEHLASLLVDEQRSQTITNAVSNIEILSQVADKTRVSGEQTSAKQRLSLSTTSLNKQMYSTQQQVIALQELSGKLQHSVTELNHSVSGFSL